jgi:hypothetical protein
MLIAAVATVGDGGHQRRLMALRIGLNWQEIAASALQNVDGISAMNPSIRSRNLL